MVKDKDLDRIHEANLHIAIMERSEGLSEVTGRPGEVIHHVLGRGKPKGFKNLHPALKEAWPHIEFLCILLTRGEHEGAHRYSKMMRVLFLNLLLVRCGDRIWNGRTCREWLNEPPAKEWM